MLKRLPRSFLHFVMLVHDWPCYKTGIAQYPAAGFYSM